MYNIPSTFIYYRLNSLMVALDNNILDTWANVIGLYIGATEENLPIFTDSYISINDAEYYTIVSLLQNYDISEIKPTSLMYQCFSRPVPDNAEDFQRYKNFAVEEYIFEKVNIEGLEYNIAYDFNAKHVVLQVNLLPSDFFVLINSYIFQHAEEVKRFINDLTDDIKYLYTYEQ
ncbi:MAG: hypothetical protein KDH96_03980 [Candidatus Riesia sp.]|nr:hypothetical protein [Candidatus Riesia sp.]